MNWHNVKLVLSREIRDQLRDRRTLFMVAVLPILLYPLVGMTFLQLKQFMQEHKTSVLVIGRAELDGMDDLPLLFAANESRFAKELVGESGIGEKVELVFTKDASRFPVPDNARNEGEKPHAKALAEARQKVSRGEYGAAIYFPPGFGKELEAFRQQLIVQANEKRGQEENDAVEPKLPQPEIIFNSANERSSFAHMRLSQILHEWTFAIGQQNLSASRVPLLAARPFEFRGQDLAQDRVRRAAVWAKILPFVVFVWALTGAFYPAVDLCAGEKERGTLETLLCSPASRAEIVWGKLLTVMIFSIATAVLNLFSLGVTGQFVMSQIKQMPGISADIGLSPPPLLSIVWLLVALVPVSALFSAICLALAAFARSTREGQYYLMPVLLIVAPLMILAISPGVELDLGKSLIPISGLVLLLRSLIEGNYSQSLPYVAPVLGVTAICCLLAIRWAIEQFSKESVLFRESERIDLRRWVAHVVRDRGETPTLTAAITCVVLMFLLRFFVGFAMVRLPMESFADIAKIVFISQVVIILFPAMLLTLFLTRNRRKSLLLDRWPTLPAIGMAGLLACLLHPVGLQVVIWIQQLYPMSSEWIAQSTAIQTAMGQSPSFWLPFVLVALLPAVCEELAFRGFILSGLRHLGHKWWAIVLSAVFFGLAHSVIQQSLSAAILGIVIGYLAVQTGSLLPCIMFHMIYNGLMLLPASLAGKSQDIVERWPDLQLVLADPSNQTNACAYHPAFITACAVLALAVLLWFQRLSYDPTTEERLEETRHQRTQESLV